MTSDPKIRPYECTSCETVVTAIWFERGGFAVGCDCLILDSCPYEMGQYETPDEWRVRRPPCCADVTRDEHGDAFEVEYGGRPADYRCPTCGATYKWDGEMVDAPPEEDDPTVTDDGQTTLDGSHR